MEKVLTNKSVLAANESLNRSVYQRLFTDMQIKAPNRLVDTSQSKWHIGIAGSVLLNFDLIEVNNPELLDQVKYLCAHFVKAHNPDNVFGIFFIVKEFLNSCESFDEETGGELADALADEILYYFASNRRVHGEGQLSRLRQWYLEGVKLKLPMFQRTVGDALRKLKLAGTIKGLDVLIQIKDKSPLHSNELDELRLLLQRYVDSFAVGQTNYFRLAATWVFITLGIRPIQLRLLMVGDLAVNVDKDTSRKTYLLNVPSAKKRMTAPRTHFRLRPIPVFLGEMLEALKNFNLKWLTVNQIDIDMQVTPLFMPTKGHHNRKQGSRISLYEHCFSCGVINRAPDKLLESLNQFQKDAGESPLELKINPRRLRKTFATHAAAVGTPAMLLMELLDHEDMQHVMIYYKLGANFSNKIDQVYRKEFGTVMEYFKGEISLKELSDTNKNEQVFGPEGLRRLVGIGLCGKYGRCSLAPPYSCYTCQKFEACNDINIHQEVLEVMVDDVDQLFENNVAPGKYDMDHINACKSLIAQLENN